MCSTSFLTLLAELPKWLRAVRPSGTVAAYVWDYVGKMEIMRQFWDVAVALDPAAHFVDFDDYWVPFAGKQGSAPTYLMSLGDESRRLLKERLRAALPIATDGSIDLIARAWAVRGQRAGA